MEQQYMARRLWKPHKPMYNPWERFQHKQGRVVKGDNFGRFDEFLEVNANLNCATKSAALQASPFVVCLTSYIGIQRLFVCSGTIMNSFGVDGEFCSTILTSATLLRCPTGEDAIADDIKVDVYICDGSLYPGEILGYDFHYNVAAIRITSTVQLQTAVIEDVDDSTERLARVGESASFQLLPHRASLPLAPHPDMTGKTVIALGRYFHHPYHIMAAPGELSLEKCRLDCKELRMASCAMTKNGIGGPLINCKGRVIGMNFYKSKQTPFLPINIASKCLEHLQNCREIPRPWLGIEISDLDTMLGKLEKLNQSPPNTVRGVIVMKVESGSPASRAGICTDDVILKSGGKPVWSSLQFMSIVMDNADKPLELCVKRAGNIAPLTLTLYAQSTVNLNRWPLPKEWSVPIYA